MKRSDREKIEAYARVVGAARDCVKSLEGVRLPYHHEAWERLIDLRNALAAFDRAHGVPPPPRASEG